VRSLLPIPLEMEFRSCPLCDAAECSTFLPFDSFGFPLRTVECRRCGLLYSNPAPTRQFLDGFYETRYRYFYEGLRKIDESYIRLRRHREVAARRAQQYGRLLPRGSSALDIGCGTGFFLSTLRDEFGMRVRGIEPDPTAADYCERHLQLEIFRGVLEASPCSEQFDLVSAFHVVEHIRCLPEFLALMRKRLRPGGCLVLETPNCAGSWNDIGMFHIAHLQTFSPHSMANLCSANGFELVESGPLENDSLNLYLIARPGETDHSVRPPLAEDSELIRRKCRGIRTRRWRRVLRTWTKWLYFQAGGLQGRILVSAHKPSMAVVRPFRPNLAEMAVYRSFLDDFEVTYYYSGLNEQACRKQLDALGLERMRAVRYRGYTDIFPAGSAQRALDFKIGLGSVMLSHLGDVLRHDVINVVDPIYFHVHQIVRRLRPSQKLVVVRWENISDRYRRIWVANRLAERALRRADLIVCVSQAALHSLQLPSGFGGQVAQVYPGIQLDASPCHQPRGRPAIIFTGRPQWAKGFSHLMAAFAIVRRTFQLDCELWAVGLDAAQFSTRATQLGIAADVKFFGLLPNHEARQEMTEAALFCFPSLVSPTWTEQFGFAMVEAMASGVPVVAFDSGAIREICGPDGVYASAGNAHSLAEALACVLRSPEAAQARGRRLSLRAAQEFSHQKQGQKLLVAIGGILSAAEARPELDRLRWEAAF